MSTEAEFSLTPVLLHRLRNINMKVLPLSQQPLNRSIDQSTDGDGAACFSGSTVEFRTIFYLFLYLFIYVLIEKLSQVSDAMRILLGEFPR